MADETSVPPDNGKHISVTRMSVGTAEVKDMHVDLLEAVNASINAQTDAITSQNAKIIKQGEDLKKSNKQQKASDSDPIVAAIKALHDTNKELIAAMRSSGGGDEEGGGGGISAAELRSRQKGLDAIHGVTEENKTLQGVLKDLNAVYKAEKKIIQSSIIEGLMHAGRSIFSFRTAMDEVTKRFTTTMDLPRSGMADFTDVFTDSTVRAAEYLASGLQSTRDDLVETSKLVKQSLQDGLVSPMVLVDGNLKDTAAAFHDFRNEMEEGGLDLYRNLGFREQNAMLSQLLDAQLRGDRMTDINDSVVRKQTMDQIAALRIIAQNSGLSLDELIKGNDVPMTLAELEASGALTGKQSAEIMPALLELQKIAPDFASDIIEVLGAGNSKSVFEAMNKDLAADYRMIGIDLFDEVQKIKNQGTIEFRESSVDILQSLGDKFLDKGVAAGQFQLSDYKRFRKMVTTGNVMKDLDVTKGDDANSVVARAFNQFENWYTNKFPAFDALKLIGSLAANTFFLGANTAALIANTIAHAPGGGILGKVGGVIGKVGKLAGGLIKFGGIVTGGLMIAKDMYDVASGDSSGRNIGGVIGGAIGGGLGALLTPVLGPLGIAGGMAVGNIAGNWIGRQFEGDSPGATPAASAISAPQVGATASVSSGSSKSALAVQSVSQTRLLENIAGSLHTNNGLQREIRDRIGFGSPGGGAAGRDSTKKSDNIAIVPGRLGAL